MLLVLGSWENASYFSSPFPSPLARQDTHLGTAFEVALRINTLGVPQRREDHVGKRQAGALR